MENQEKLQELQVLEQNLQNVLMQKQTFQIELAETQGALEELEKSGEEVYKIIGQLMIKSEKAKMKIELEEKIFDNKKESSYFENKEFVNHYLDDDDIEKFYVLSLTDDDKMELKRLYSPSLLDCLNYLYENEIDKNGWNIYDLK